MTPPKILIKIFAIIGQLTIPRDPQFIHPNIHILYAVRLAVLSSYVIVSMCIFYDQTKPIS